MDTREYNYVRKTFRYDGKRYSVYGKTEEEALEKKVALIGVLERGELCTGSSPTVSDWYQQWRRLYKEPADLTAKSLSAYDEKFRNYIRPAIGHMKLRDVREQHLQQILNAQSGMSHSHLVKLRSLMQQLFRRARKSRLIVFDPSEDLSLPAYRRGTRRSLTDAERRAFLAAEPQHPGGVLFYTMLHTGMRPGELVALQWRDVDFERNEIHVTRALESGSWHTIKAPKTAAGTRIIPIRAELRQRLEPLQGLPQTLVFVNQIGNMHSRASLMRLWGRIKADMGRLMDADPEPDLVPYCLRHTFCTDLQRAGVPINVAKELMGHSDISVTANIYTHRDTDVLHANMAKLDALNSPKSRRKSRKA